MKSVWEKVKLGDVLNYEQPTKYIVFSDNYIENGIIPVLTAGKSFILGYTMEDQGIFDDVPAIIFDDFTTSIQYVDFPFKVKSSAMKILKANKEKADIKFLFYLMSTIHMNCEEHKRYWISKFSNIEIPLPPLPTQKRIAAILDKAQALCDLEKQIIQKYNQLAQSVFLEMFGDLDSNPNKYDKCEIHNICEIITDGTHYPPKFINKGIPFLFISNIINNEINFNTNKFISNADYDILYKRTPIELGDILFTTVGSYGNPAIVKNESKFMFQRHIGYLKPNHNLVNFKFLFSSLLNVSTKRQIDRMVNGVAQKTLNLSDLKKVIIFLPSINEQNEFSIKFDNIEVQKQLTQQSLNKSEELFQCLLQKAFKGELVT